MSRDVGLGSASWRQTFEERLATRARLAKLTQWASVSVGPPRFIDGNHAFYLHDGQRHLAWMLAAIKQAKKRVDLEIYIYEPDETGIAIRAALVDAAKRGVVVRLLYDAVGGANAGSAFFQPILDAGGYVTEFNPVAPWRLRVSRLGRRQHWEPNHRDHRKVLVCDTTVQWAKVAEQHDPDDPPPEPPKEGETTEEATIAITGGRNIADNYLGHALGHGQWRDCGAVIFGPVGIRLAEMFDSMWEHAAGEDVIAPALKSPELGAFAIMALGSQPGFLNLLQFAISSMARAVHREIRISCAYFIPTSRLRRALRFLAKHRRSCKLIIPLHNDVPIVAAASRHFLGTLLKAGVEIYRYAAETLHEKTLIYDGKVTVVGSSNLDQRSFRLNYELSVIVVGERFAGPVIKWHDADLLDSERYTLEAWENRPLWEKVVDWFWSLFRSQL